MKVKAKYQLAYNNRSYKAGEEFELHKDHYEQFKNDVVEVKGVATKKVKKESNKKVKSLKNK